MLIMDLTKDFAIIFTRLFLSIDKLVYSLVGYFYRIFLVLANNMPFSYDAYKDIVDRIYLLLAIVMLFVITYQLLLSVVNPDAKEANNSSKLLVNVVISVVLLLLLPTVYTVIERVQTAILNNNVIGSVILGDTSGSSANGSDLSNEDTTSLINQGGRNMTISVFSAFFSPSDTSELSAEQIENDSTVYCGVQDGEPVGVSNLKSAYLCAQYVGNYDPFYSFAENVVDGDISYLYIISTIAGGFLVYIIISFCFDLGIRVVKLAFLQIISPIPVLCRILPKAKDIFSNWLKMLISVYLEVFVRVITMYFGIYLIQLFINEFSQWISSTGIADGSLMALLCKAFVIMGIVAFIKQAPKLLSKIFPGMDSGNMKLGIKDKLAAGGAFTAAGAVGAGTLALARHGVSTVNKFKDKKNWLGENGKFSAKKAGANIVGGLIGGGVLSSVVRGGKAGVKAKSFSEASAAASQGFSEFDNSRKKREAYIASHGGVGKSAAGLVSDGFNNFKDLVGATSGRDVLEKQVSQYKSGMDLKNSAFSIVENDKRVATYRGEKDAWEKMSASEIMAKYSVAANGAVMIKNENEAIKFKQEQIDSYDNKVKVASVLAFQEKLASGDARALKVQYDLQKLKDVNPSDSVIQSLTNIDNLSANQFNDINKYLNTTISSFDKDGNALDSTGVKIEDLLSNAKNASSILSNDDILKKAKSYAEFEIAKKRDEKNKSSNKPES